MKLDADWLVKNWEFLSARRIRTFRPEQVLRLLQDGQAPTQGRFYGTPEFLERYRSYSSITNTGSHRLFMRPFIIAPLPESGMQAVYVDPKKYVFDEDENIKEMKSLFEVPIYVFKD